MVRRVRRVRRRVRREEEAAAAAEEEATAAAEGAGGEEVEAAPAAEEEDGRTTRRRRRRRIGGGGAWLAEAEPEAEVHDASVPVGEEAAHPLEDRPHISKRSPPLLSYRFFGAPATPRAALGSSLITLITLPYQ